MTVSMTTVSKTVSATSGRRLDVDLGAGLPCLLSDGRRARCEPVMLPTRVMVLGVPVNADPGDWLLRLPDATAVWPSTLFSACATVLSANA